MSAPLYEFEHEFVFTCDYADDVCLAYAGTADPASTAAAVQAAVAKMKTVMKHVACPSMSIRAEADGHSFKVTLLRG